MLMQKNGSAYLLFLDKTETDSIISEHQSDPSKRLLQKKLAEEVTKFVHGNAELEKAVETTQKLFANQTTAAEDLSVEDLEGMEGVIKSQYEKSKIKAGIDVVTFLAESNIFSSKGEARKMIQGGGLSINRNKVDSDKMKIDESLLLHKKYILVQKGKKHYYLVIVD